jgi:hypothetical protein
MATPLPAPIADWFARRGWTPHPQQLARHARAGYELDLEKIARCEAVE